MKMFCIKDLLVRYDIPDEMYIRGMNAFGEEQRLTKGKIYEINDSYVNNCTILTFMDDVGTQRTFQIYVEHFITIEEWRQQKLNQIL